jgi:DNA-binding GntR family transcriptional regulator
MSGLAFERPLSLTDAAAASLSGAILAGQFAPGQRLVETDLSASLGISRAPVREALRALAAEGLVEIRQNRGTFVVCPSADEIEQMALFRGLIEGAAARLVASHRQQPALERLAAILAEQRDAYSSGEWQAFLDAHWRFHHGICVESGNPYLTRALNSVSKLIRLYHRITGVDRDRMLRNNSAFLQAMSRRSPEQAEELLRSQIIRVAYETLGRAIPEAVAGYVTCLIDTQGRLKPIKQGNWDDGR